ncbi:carbohydrate ABC transporter substrate-binding protein (CUT1 family) [Microbacterium sp. AG1240]|uniref:ABC transporter substrate-binding protein n=1 Tax=Microbacterium sp. AG1240 TaxID=2183992 RepID=UPI000EB343D3|nr:sugar ABC transporter substrate-binding protein [Microbacterium sp. AG1240]RKT31522.1 carbohydrate ABC transporter substrate-binding protein (CUT1 family) [Microbacterium sp. AG1240]
MKRSIGAAAALVVLAMPLAACSGGSSSGGGTELTSGPISIWYSTNEQEIAWAEAVVDAWNADNPDAQVTAAAIPSGKSSEDAISAAITAGNTPCLVYATAPAAVPAFQKQGGLVNISTTFEDGESFVKERSGEAADGFRSPDGDLYQLPWKANPFMLYYNKTAFAEAGLDAENPSLATYDDVLAAAEAIKDSGAADFALYPPASGDYTNALFDFYPFYLANSGGEQLVVDDKATFTSEAGLETLEFWKTLYAEGYSSAEAYSGDAWAGPFADGVAAMGIAGPWGAAQFDGKVEYGVVPLPTADGKTIDETYTFGDSKNVGLYTSCENKQTAWDFAKFSMDADNDLALLETTGQFPIRTDLTEVAGDFLAANPLLETFAKEVPLTVDVPNIANSSEIWQTFRDAWGGAVQTGQGDLADVMKNAGSEIDTLASQG